MVVEQPRSGVAAGNLTRSAAARYVLVRKGDTWHAAQTLSPELRGGELSDAIIASRTDVSGQQEWQARAHQSGTWTRPRTLLGLEAPGACCRCALRLPSRTA